MLCILKWNRQEINGIKLTKNKYAIVRERIESWYNDHIHFYLFYYSISFCVLLRPLVRYNFYSHYWLHLKWPIFPAAFSPLQRRPYESSRDFPEDCSRLENDRIYRLQILCRLSSIQTTTKSNKESDQNSVCANSGVKTTEMVTLLLVRMLDTRY